MISAEILLRYSILLLETLDVELSTEQSIFSSTVHWATQSWATESPRRFERKNPGSCYLFTRRRDFGVWL